MTTAYLLVVLRSGTGVVLDARGDDVALPDGNLLCGEWAGQLVPGCYALEVDGARRIVRCEPIVRIADAWDRRYLRSPDAAEDGGQS